MANYVAVCRSNFFKVKDIDAFCEAMVPALAGSDLELWVENGRVAFGGYCSLPFVIPDAETGDSVEFDLEGTIQRHLAFAEEAILVEVGYEKLRYVGGVQIRITAEDVERVEIGVS